MAVYTTLTAQDIAGFLKRYPVGALKRAIGIAEGIENTNYLVTTHDGKAEKRYILTLFEQRVRDTELPFFMRLTEWMADRGIPCPRPIKGRDGNTIYILKGKPAALVQFLEGRNNPKIMPQHLTQAGELIARMHLAAEGFPMLRRNTMGLEDWKLLFQKFRNRADEIYLDLEKDIAFELAYVSKHWPQSLPSGVIHADIFPDNVFFGTDGTSELKVTGVIDFYFACNDFWVYDLLICMNAWCFDSNFMFVPERAQALFAAYQRLRPLTEAECMAMPVLARGAALRFLMTRAHDWLIRPANALVVPKDPMEYAAKLQFHQQVKHYREYGL